MEEKTRQSFIVSFMIVLLFTYYHFAIAQTCIVIRRTPSKVVVGADSKLVKIDFAIDNDGKEYQIRKEGIKCKIRQTGNTFYAISGLDLPSIDNFVEESCKSGQSFAEKSERFTNLISKPLASALEKIRLQNPEFYKERFMGKPSLQIVLFGIENSVPSYRVIDLIAKNSLSEPVHLEQQVTSNPGTLATQSSTSIMGYAAAIEKLNLTEDFWEGLDTIEGIKKLITIESTEESENVGGAIDIIRLTKSGAKWVQRKTECPDIIELRR
jgi:hypothetical protein